MSCERPAKRSRLSTPDSDVSGTLDEASCTHGDIPVTVQEDEDVWFWDGDVILSPQGKAPSFRVYRDLLERESPVFRSIFAQTIPDAAKTADGCPVVYLNDSASQLKTFLLVLLCGENYYYEHTGYAFSITFENLSALIRLGHKYQIQDIVDDGVARLKRFYPIDYCEWEDRAIRSVYVTATGADAPEAISLAYLTDTPSILPTAYLTCATLGSEPPPVEGEDEDEDEDGGETAEDHSLLSLVRTLAPSDLERVISGKLALGRSRAVRLLSILRAVPAPYCTREERCMIAHQRNLRECRVDDFKHAVDGAQAFEPLHEWLWESVDEVALCGACATESSQIDERMALGTWCELPSMFNLSVEGWPKTWRDVLESSLA
ncbi:hypothetical protein C8Q70DRAFT_1055981 [Cubamyces menziesii]|nr:hypothetical protein C8Q70DRAFT_1055981 [Cubamyces menziesii]